MANYPEFVAAGGASPLIVMTGSVDLGSLSPAPWQTVDLDRDCGWSELVVTS